MGPIRIDLRRSPGHARLDGASFITDPAVLTPASTTQLVAELVASPSLAAVHQLALDSVSLRPTPLPVADGSSNVTIAPSDQLTATVVLRNAGNVAERGIAVSATIQTVAGQGGAASARRSVDLVAQGVVAVPLGPMRVRPGTTIQLQVAVAAPPGQADAAGLTQSFTIVVAPATRSLGAG
jgi:hypothetical protein